MTDEDKDRALIEEISARHESTLLTHEEGLPGDAGGMAHKDRHDLLRIVQYLQVQVNGYSLAMDALRSEYEKQSQDLAQLMLDYVRDAARLEDAQKLIDRQAEEIKLLREVVNMIMDCAPNYRSHEKFQAACHALADFDKENKVSS